MPSQPPLHTAVFAALDSSALVLTANQRAARTLAGVYAQRMRTEGRTVWQLPTILAWESWAETLWQQLVLRGAETRVRLSPMQERLLWKDILAKDAEARTLRSPESLASLAADAWSLLARYNGIDANGGISRLRAQFEAASTDTRTFLRWAQLFERRCRKDTLLPAAQLDAALIPHIAQSKLFIGHTEILLVGFDRMTPAQTALCDALRASGIAVTMHTLPDEQRSLRILETTDEEAEMRAAARAIRAMLTANPQARIAVILPDVPSVRSKLERIFLSELAPELQVAGAQAPRPFEFSLGVTLDRIAMTRTALSLLRWTLHPLPLEEVSALLLSPYLAGAQTERYARAVWDAQQLRRATLLEPEISLAWILKQTQLPPMLRAQLSALQKLVEEKRPAANARQKKPALTSYSTWMEHTAALLAAAGWPTGSDRSLDSTEFQLQDRWQELLDEIATLDFTGERVDFATAVTAIEGATVETLFAPQSHNAPVQIMGALESAGSVFDTIWFLGATDMAWPAAAGTHPFIPWTVQRDLAMPGTDATRALGDGIAITKRIAASAPETTFSFAHRGSEGEQRPSTCLRKLGDAEWLRDNAITLPSAPIITLEEAPDDITLPALPDAVMRGGATILKLQAACPFRAFAAQRLGSTALDSTEAGLDARERGDMIHRVLAAFWNKVLTQRALQQMTEAERMQQLNAAIDIAFSRFTADTPWEKQYLQVQRDWLLQLLPQWLDYELLRPPFQVIATERTLADQRIGPLRIEMRVDRIDAALPDGVIFAESEKQDAPLQIILDYKTSNSTEKSWDGPRPDEPQLPLYAALAPEETLHGVAFAKVRVGDMEFRGIASSAEMLGAKHVAQEDVGYRVSEWRTVLTQLADDFARGDSAVDPKQPPETCKHCEQKPLCRIQELQAFAAEDSESEEAQVD